MAKGIPLMGRDPDGKAKIINVDENGNVIVQQSGTMAVNLLANAISIPPQAWGSWLDIPAGKRCVLTVACTQPWKMDTNTLRGVEVADGAATHMYPDRNT